MKTWQELLSLGGAYLDGKGVPDAAVALELLMARLLKCGRGFLSPHLAKIPEERLVAALRRGMARVVTNTHLQGRWQTIGREPLTICETAHNAPGIDAMLGKLATMPFAALHVVYGCVNDKDYRKILTHLHAEFARLGKPFDWRFSQPSVPRGLPVADLQAAAREMGIDGKAFANVKEAIADARAAADPADLVLVTGSIFLIADALA